MCDRGCKFVAVGRGLTKFVCGVHLIGCGDSVESCSCLGPKFDIDIFLYLPLSSSWSRHVALNSLPSCYEGFHSVL